MEVFSLQMDRSKAPFHTLPNELQSLVLDKLPFSSLNPSLVQMFDPDVLEDQYRRVERGAPKQLSLKLAYYEKKGFDYGLRRFFDGRYLDEGLSFPLLQEVGKRGDSRMIRYLLTHGVLNIDVALSSGILAGHNNFVTELISDTPVYNLNLLLQSCLDSDNLEMMRFLAARMPQYYETFFRTNRTSYWLKKFYDYNIAFWVPESLRTLYYESGFGVDPRIGNMRILTSFMEEIVESFCSDLPDPLPFTYTELEELYPENLLELLKRFIPCLLNRKSRNFSRVEWLISNTDRFYHLIGETLEMHAGVWITELLKLSLRPESFPLFDYAKGYLGPDWALLVDPLPEDPAERERALTRIFALVPIDIWFWKYYPVQESLLTVVIPLFLDDRDESNRHAMIQFVISQHPDRVLGTWMLDPFSLTEPSDHPSDLIPPHFPTFDFHTAILRFFESNPVYTLSLLLRYRLLDLWNELSPRYKPRRGEWPRDYESFTREAVKAGLNDMSVKLYSIEPDYAIDFDFETIGRRYPRLRREFTGPWVPPSLTILGSRDDIVSKNKGAIKGADLTVQDDELFIAGRMRNELMNAENSDSDD